MRHLEDGAAGTPATRPQAAPWTKPPAAAAHKATGDTALWGLFGSARRDCAGLLSCAAPCEVGHSSIPRGARAPAGTGCGTSPPFWFGIRLFSSPRRPVIRCGLVNKAIALVLIPTRLYSRRNWVSTNQCNQPVLNFDFELGSIGERAHGS